MLKSNSKYTKEKIKNWILSAVSFKGRPEEDKKLNYEEIRQKIRYYCQMEKIGCGADAPARLKKYYSDSYYIMFEDWVQGLPSLLDTAQYFYSGSACELLADWLQETPQEAAKYSEMQAEDKITKLLYREIYR